MSPSPKKRAARHILLIALLAFLTLLAVLSGCDNVKPTLAATPTPTASPTPLPDALTFSVTAAPLPTDALGAEIWGGDHYRQYLSFGEIRVYEYDNGTFLDGLCVNAYPLPLDGRINVVYYTAEGKVCGVGTLHNALGTTVLDTGTNAIYAEISTDIDVTMLDFVLEYQTEFAPAEGE